MDKRQLYKGRVIEANPRKLVDGSGWTEDYNIEIFHEDRTDVTRCFSGRIFPTRAEAIAACISEGRQNIDGAPAIRATDQQSANALEATWKDAAVPENLKATWDEKESLRAALQGAPDRLIGEAVLRYAKDKRIRTLDELDGEPE